MNRPKITINIAMTADGKIDTFERLGAKISSDDDWKRVDRLRAASDGVMVGGNTLIGEDPRLTVKDAKLRADRVSRGLHENPIKVGVLSKAKIQTNGRFVQDGNSQVMLFTTTQASPENVIDLEREGVKVFTVGDNRVDLTGMMEILFDHNINKLLVEGGGTLNEALIQAKLVDEIIIYIAPLIFGGAQSPTLADGLGFTSDKAIKLNPISAKQLENGGVILKYEVIN